MRILKGSAKKKEDLTISRKCKVLNLKIGPQQPTKYVIFSDGSLQLILVHG